MPQRPYAALPIAWAIIILILTLLPSAEMPPTPKWELLAFDTAAHAGVFGLLALLSWFSLRRQTRWPRLARHPGWPLLLGCSLFGGLIELLQTTMHLGRQGDVKDLIGDTIGAALALGLGWLLRHRVPAAPRLVPLLLLAATLATTHRAGAQDLARARQTIATLASPRMHGRGYVYAGERKAADYLRGRLKALKLEPLALNYTQPFTLDVNTFPGKMSLTVSAVPKPGVMGTQKEQKLRPGIDFIAAPNSASTARLTSAVALRFDTLAFSQEFWRQQLAENMRKMLKMPAGVAQLLVLTEREEKQLAALPVAFRQTIDSLPNRVVLAPKLTASLAATQIQAVRFEAVDNPAIWGKFIHNQPFALATYQVDARFRRDYPTQNLAAVIRGTAQPDSFLVVSAHYDHLGMMGKKVYFPGANDNASGVALLLELAAHYARPENRPACSVVFLLFGAEEAGLVGSRYFVAHPLVPLARIKFLVNLDLLGTGEQGATVVNGKVFEAPYRRLLALNEAHHYLPALGARGRAANSDHFPFSEAGVPAFFIYTRGGSAAYHDVNDRPAALSLAGFTGAFGLVRDFLNELGAKK